MSRGEEFPIIDLWLRKLPDPPLYFPSIEKKYGKPIDHWMKQLDAVADATHMVQVAYLKDSFEMGHGHANAIVRVYRQNKGPK
jgi:hypothetical protein